MSDQLTQANLDQLAKAGMHAEIDAARIAGQLDDLLGIKRHRAPSEGQWTAEDLAAMTKAGRVEEIEAAGRSGQLSVLLTGTDRTNG